MIPMNPYVLATIAAIAGIYFTVQAVKAPIAHAGRRACHAVTLGHKCHEAVVALPAAFDNDPASDKVTK